jgi:carboxyl-terminal processing protease
MGLLVAFLLGVMLERHGFMPGLSHHEPPGLGSTFDPFWEAWNLVEKRYVDRTAVQPRRMTEGAIEGMLASLGDVGHTGLSTAEDYRRKREELKGRLQGIGARMTLRNRRPTVVDTVPGSPARSAGLQPGDVLVEVDGKSVVNMPLERIVDRIRGPTGTDIQLTILREGQPKALHLTVTRAEVHVPDVSWHMIPGRPLAHLAIQSFGENCDAQLRAALAEIGRQGAGGVVVDVRGNAGGLKDQAVAVTSEFLAEGVVFIEQDGSGNRERVPVKPGGVATKIPITLLVDGGSASSAEIFAGAIQDHHRAKLVGSKTFGTGTVIQPFALSNGSAVLLAVAEWLTPEGRQIWHHGIQPDVSVEMPEGAAILTPEAEARLTADSLTKVSDKPLLRALEMLNAQVSGKTTTVAAVAP